VHLGDKNAFAGFEHPFASHNPVSGQLDFSLRAQGYLRIPLVAWHEHLLLKLSTGSKESNLDGVGSYAEHFASLFE